MGKAQFQPKPTTPVLSPAQLGGHVGSQSPLVSYRLTPGLRPAQLGGHVGSQSPLVSSV